MVGPAEADIEFDIIKNDNDTFTVKYTPPGAGRYTIMVLFAEQVRTQFSSKARLMSFVKGFFELYLLLCHLLGLIFDLLLSGNSHQSIQSESGSFP